MTFTAQGTRTPTSETDSGGIGRATWEGTDESAVARPGQVLELGTEATRYEIVRPLGAGGTGEVFLARQLGPEGFTRLVALKRMQAGFDVDASTRRAFVYEAKLASRLRHPGIAEVQGLALAADRYYLVLEYVEGATLRSVLRDSRGGRRRLGEAFACHIAASVADALHHVHTLADDEGKPLGIVHRDVTPMNIMVARSGTVKLLDFGIALSRLPGRERTCTGGFRGTFEYASPEQALGEKLDGRSDLFSLGSVLVEMLTGVRVLEVETDFDAIRKIGEWRADDVREATAALPRQLAAICAKALARRRADRYEDGWAFSRALREYLTERGITYAASNCATELDSLGVLSGPEAERPASGVEVGDVAVAKPDAASGVLDDPMARHPVRRRRWPQRAAIAAAVPFLAFGTHGFVAPPPSAPPPQSAPAVIADVPDEAEPIVRPKRKASGTDADAGGAKRQASAVRRERPARRITFGDFDQDHATGTSPLGTLPRGTLVPVRLERALGGARPGPVGAVVTEDVSANGVILVNEGSTVSCYARPPADGRVRLSCDTIRAPDRTLTFAGEAVGEGQHVGLRLVDDEVAAGRRFVVYVSASALLR